MEDIEKGEKEREKCQDDEYPTRWADLDVDFTSTAAPAAAMVLCAFLCARLISFEAGVNPELQ
jgi:hypothetical protein